MNSRIEIINQQFQQSNQKKSKFTVGIVGGGVGGSTTALKLAKQGVNVILFEENESLISGTPFCHLHTGGNLYREISDEQCIHLLHECIDTMKEFPSSINTRPTVICVPKKDTEQPPELLLRRLELLRNEYAFLIEKDIKNKVMGESYNYYREYQKEDLMRLRKYHQSEQQEKTMDDWIIPFAKNVDLDDIKYPVIMVQEYGLSIFRMAAQIQLELSQLPNCQIKLKTKVQNIKQNSNNKWTISYGQQQQVKVDFLVNACGYQSGYLDDMAGFKRERMVEFKAAYVVKWNNNNTNEKWPEVIFHGVRGTKNGMAQMTPYEDGFFQLHGMTDEITLFKGGLVKSQGNSSQPKLNQDKFKNKLEKKWDFEEAQTRSQKAIEHLSQFVPRFITAQSGYKPLCGAQQIPGKDSTYRAGNQCVTFQEGKNYARCEIVKGNSAISAAEIISQYLKKLRFGQKSKKIYLKEVEYEQIQQKQDVDFEQIEKFGMQIAEMRGFPAGLAAIYNKNGECLIENQ